MSQPTTESPPCSGESTMQELLDAFPGARRSLFARYHIGGCQSCGFQPEETLAEVCARNEDAPVDEVLEHLQNSHEHDQRLLIEPRALKAAIENDDPPRLVDIRTREEFESVAIAGARLFSQELQQEAFSSWDKDAPVVLYDHMGDRSLDAASFFIGHGMHNVRALRGGIDAYSQEADNGIPRYRIEFEQ